MARSSDNTMNRECCDIVHSLIKRACYRELNLGESAEDLWLLGASLVWLGTQDSTKDVIARKIECVKCAAEKCIQVIPVAIDSEGVTNTDCDMETFTDISFEEVINCEMIAYVE